MANAPEIVFRHGACSASVFENSVMKDGETTTVKNVKFQKSYRDRRGEWQHTSCLNPNDILKAVLVLNKAYEYLTSGSHGEDES